jgi:hypothetical protein
MALSGTEAWRGGFVRNTTTGVPVVTYTTTGAVWYAGFLRDPDGRLIVRDATGSGEAWYSGHLRDTTNFALVVAPEGTGTMSGGFVRTATGALVATAGAVVAKGRDADGRLVLSGLSAGSDFPNASTTGVPSGVTLTPSPGNLTLDTPGQTADALDITGWVYINANNVTLKRSRIRVGNQTNLYIASGLSGVLVEDVEIDGMDTSGTGVNISSGATCRRLHIHSTENGANVRAGGGSLVDSYITDLFGDEVTHSDGIQFDADAGNFTIDNCNIEIAAPSFAEIGTGGVNLNNEITGTNHDITIQNSRVDGRGSSFCFYFPRYAGWSNIHVLNNRLIPSALTPGDPRYSDGTNATAWPGGGVTTWSGNVDDLTGDPVAVDD